MPYSFLRLVSLLTLLATLSGCLPVAIGAATTTAGVSIAQERTTGDAVDDTTIWTKVKSQLLQKDVNNLFNLVNVTVLEGRVLLLGSVRSAEVRDQAVKIAWSVRGVKEVIDELTIVPSVEQTDLADYSKDSWITAQIKSQMLMNENIHSINYTIQTLNGVVYLMGIAQDKTELNMVTNLASTVKYVKKVVSHVRVKNTPLQQTNQIY